MSLPTSHLVEVAGAEELAAFNRDGFLHIPGVLTPEEIAALKAGVDRVFEDDCFKANRYSDYIAARLFETDPIFEEMLTREPIISLIENILGKDCHLIAENVVRNAPGQAIDFFHADDLVILPIAEGMERHDPRLTMPVFICTVQIPLTDIPSIEYGPTEYVPGSHYSGREPNDPYRPSFEGREPVPIFCNAGDIYLHNGQCWHRGAPNTSTRTRYLFQLSYGMRWVSQRFYPFMNYQLPQHVLDNADERRKRVLGFHPQGAYG
jgi:ectoine hydroxylase-related dioxygenase (phytanoyl-CoA dioxygenase family)